MFQEPAQRSAFGRRGSGKSSLLRKAGADLTLDRRPIAHVNLEAFKGHSYQREGGSGNSSCANG